MAEGFAPGSGAVRAFVEHHFLHYNARETVAAAKAYEAHLDAGGKMFVTLAGAMSTARLGRILSRMIRAGKVHGICCTGANLEEDLFNLLAAKEYEPLANWRALSAEDEAALAERGMNRVTDTAIPETVMRHVEGRLRTVWERVLKTEERLFPFEFFYEVLGQEDLAEHFQIPREDSWVLAAKEMGLPIYSPGWEDSTIGNIFTAWAMETGASNHEALRTGTEQLAHLSRWYRTACGLPAEGVRDRPPESVHAEGPPGAGGLPGVGFFQIGGGIAGDFPICAVPMMRQDLKWHDTPMWGYFCQIGDAVTSYGGYSGAVPNEKITWGKLEVDTPKFMIQSDATIVAPLIFAYVLGD
ncbi:MAG: deoxyhypusine synthase family protein [Planctomycetota bacterium]